MQNLDLPANIYLMHLTNDLTDLMRPVTTLDLFEGGTLQNFHSDGLFSTEIFGRVGSPERDLIFSYVDIKVEIFHPLIYQTLCQLKNLYKGIMTGKAYAKWDDKEKDFVASDIINGDSGYHFFLKHWKKIEFKSNAPEVVEDRGDTYIKQYSNASSKRAVRIQLINKARKDGTATTTKVLVLPAGLRDIEVDELGRHRQGEINDKYRALLSGSNAVSTSSDLNTPILNTTRCTLQNAFNDIYDYFKQLIKGKNGLIQRKWGSRNIINGTRNVITAMDTSTSFLGARNAPKINSTVYGLFQTIKGTLPITQYLILQGWLTNVFTENSDRAFLVDPKTLHRTEVQLDVDTIDRWTTTAGIEKVINSYEDIDRRHKPLRIKGYYVGLIYRGPDNTFKIFGDIDELPSHLSRKNVHPLTLLEFIYIAGYRRWNKIATLVTRHPVTGIGSIYPSWCYVKTTMKSDVRFELNDTWEVDQFSKDNPALEYPTFGDMAYVDSQQVHPSRLPGLGGDYDGDMTTGNFLMIGDSEEEITTYLQSTRAYIDNSGGLQASPIVEVVTRVLTNITGD